MKNRLLVRFVFGALLALLPVFLSGGPWDPNRARPPGFQQNLGYLANDLYDYPQANVRSARTSMLTEDLKTTMIDKLKEQGYAPSSWEALGQQTVDAYKAQYEGAKTTLRQTKTDPEGIIRAIEGNQPIAGDLLEDPLVQALILIKWQILGVAERTYQSLVYANLLPGAGSGSSNPSQSVPTIDHPKPGKGKPGIDWKRMREARRRAIERRRAFEERAAREARQRTNDLYAILTELLRLRAQSANKFQARPAGGYVPLPPSLTAEPEAPAPAAPTEPKPTIEEIEKIDEEIAEAVEDNPADKAAAEEKPLEKVTIYRGTLVLRRQDGWGDELWDTVKKIYRDILAKPPGATDMNDKGDEVTWRYKLLTPGGHPAKSDILQDIPDAATEENAEGEPAPKEEPPKTEGNGDASPVSDDVVPGTEQKPEEPKPKAKAPAKASPKPEPKPEPVAQDVPGYWYDPTDASRKSKDKYIYVRVDGEALRVPLKEAKAYGVPATASLDNMTWYSEATGEIVEGKDRGTQRGSTQPQSTNKFAKPRK